MLGVKMKTDSRAFVGYLRTKGILTVAAGDNVVRVLPPLTIEEATSPSSSRACRRPRRITTSPKRHDRPALPQPLGCRAEAIAAILNEAMERKQTPAGWPKGKPGRGRAAGPGTCWR